MSPLPELCCSDATRRRRVAVPDDALCPANYSLRPRSAGIFFCPGVGSAPHQAPSLLLLATAFFSLSRRGFRPTSSALPPPSRHSAVNDQQSGDQETQLDRNQICSVGSACLEGAPGSRVGLASVSCRSRVPFNKNEGTFTTGSRRSRVGLASVSRPRRSPLEPNGPSQEIVRPGICHNVTLPPLPPTQEGGFELRQMIVDYSIESPELPQRSVQETRGGVELGRVSLGIQSTSGTAARKRGASRNGRKAPPPPPLPANVCRQKEEERGGAAAQLLPALLPGRNGPARARSASGPRPFPSFGFYRAARVRFRFFSSGVTGQAHAMPARTTPAPPTPKVVCSPRHARTMSAPRPRQCPVTPGRADLLALAAASARGRAGRNGHARVRSASGPRPFLQILSCAPRPARVRCRFPQWLEVWRQETAMEQRESPEPSAPGDGGTAHRSCPMPLERWSLEVWGGGVMGTVSAMAIVAGRDVVWHLLWEVGIPHGTVHGTFWGRGHHHPPSDPFGCETTDDDAAAEVDSLWNFARTPVTPHPHIRWAPAPPGARLGSGAPDSGQLHLTRARCAPDSGQGGAPGTRDRRETDASPL
eukprot:gene6418-biopygen14922